MEITGQSLVVPVSSLRLGGTRLRSKLQACHSGGEDLSSSPLPVLSSKQLNPPTETPSLDLAALLSGTDRQKPRAAWLALVA